MPPLTVSLYLSTAPFSSLDVREKRTRKPLDLRTSWIQQVCLTFAGGKKAANRIQPTLVSKAERMDRFDEDWGWLPHGDDTIKTCVRGLIGFNLMIGAEAEDDFLGKEKRCSFIIVFVQKALCSNILFEFWS